MRKSGGRARSGGPSRTSTIARAGMSNAIAAAGTACSALATSVRAPGTRDGFASDPLQQHDASASTLAQPWRIASQTSCDEAARSGPIAIARRLAVSMTESARVRVDITMLANRASVVPAPVCRDYSAFSARLTRSRRGCGNFSDGSAGFPAGRWYIRCDCTWHASASIAVVPRRGRADDRWIRLVG